MNPSQSTRWEALDVVRGLTVAGMLLVNNPGTWDAVYPPLRHAEWHGWTPTDLIFPLFLFIVGITTDLSLGRRAEQGASDGEIRRKVLVRGGLIVLSGILLAAFPFWPLSRVVDVRIPGVLQRIGVCYAIGALISWRRSDRSVAIATAALLLGYWAMLTLVPVPGQAFRTIDVPDQTIAAYLDRLLLGGHLWASSKTWDPEGPLSTIPAIGTVLLGVLAGRMSRRAGSLEARLAELFGWGAVGVVLGLVWNWGFPINKSLWTSSYVVFTAGVAALFLATVTWALEVRGWRRWAAPFRAFGLNPLVAFLGSGAMARAIGSLLKVESGGERLSLQQLVYQRAFASWLAPINASLGYALAFVVLWYLILLTLERRRWIIRI
jgi:predicted acyltransferase